ncbi:MAG: hypothetical protein GF364_14645 [Candidatus Lokiarchaeota archaeon]|nr:hypothetical protein [Candidatus Lokiarchaeota archaeon]
MARLRTLMALERNNLAEERTALAQFRTGLALTLIAPPSIIIYFSTTFDLELPLFLNVFIYVLTTFIIAFGVFMVVRSYKEVSLIKDRKKNIKKKELEIINKSSKVNKLLDGCTYFRDICEEETED